MHSKRRTVCHSFHTWRSKLLQCIVLFAFCVLITGEDRWLCTLLLQQGYRVEYCAASDALTYAPETFKEFFNQRRRWIPSTLANIMDLLMDYKNTIKINESISLPYIIYQVSIESFLKVNFNSVEEGSSVYQSIYWMN